MMIRPNRAMPEGAHGMASVPRMRAHADAIGARASVRLPEPMSRVLAQHVDDRYWTIDPITHELVIVSDTEEPTE